MLKTFAIIGAIAVVVIAGILIYAATKSDSFRVRRVVLINAPSDKVFPLINDMKAWTVWSPYEKKDPAMKRTHSGASSGKGAVYEWDGNREVGSGGMEITDIAPASKVTIKLDFKTPFEGHNVANFTLEPNGDSTAVKWTMDGPNSYMGKVMSVFINMDNMIGKDFETGLANLKAIAEK